MFSSGVLVRMIFAIVSKALSTFTAELKVNNCFVVEIHLLWHWFRKMSSSVLHTSL